MIKASYENFAHFELAGSRTNRGGLARPEFTLSYFGESMCMARAPSPIKRGSDGKWFDVRWMKNYVRTSKGWQIGVSQATGLPNTVQDAT